MNRIQNKATLLSICLLLTFVTGALLYMVGNDSNASIVINLVFASVFLRFCQQWFIVDAEQHGLTFENERERSRFGRASFIFPLYFRTTRGEKAWRSNFLALGFLFLVFLVALIGQILGFLLVFYSR